MDDDIKNQIDIEIDENGIPIYDEDQQYDENGMPIYDEDQQYDENGMPIYDDEDEQLELRRIVSEKLLNNVLEFEKNDTKIDKVQTNNKTNKKKTLSLSDLNKLMDVKIQESQPKKFVSQRCAIKKPETKQVIVDVPNLNKRCFNPRKVAYFFSDEYKNKKISMS